jgi:hypothetical protein
MDLKTSYEKRCTCRVEFLINQLNENQLNECIELFSSILEGCRDTFSYDDNILTIAEGTPYIPIVLWNWTCWNPCAQSSFSPKWFVDFHGGRGC